MGLCELPVARTFTELKKMVVKSKDKLKIGNIIDIIFDSDYNIHSFILGGGRWEEFREALGIIDDIDPVVLVEDIKEIKEKEIQLSVAKAKLKHKLEEDALPAANYSYSSLKRKKIYDSNGNKFARIMNVILLPCGEPVFVLGGTWFEELSERLKFKENVDLLLPIDEIESIDEKTIRLMTPLDKLNLSLDDKPMDFESQRIYLDSLKTKGQAKIRLLERQKGEEFRDFTRFK